MMAVAFAVLAVAGPTSAAEPELGDAGHLAVSAERLFGYVHSTVGTSLGGGVTLDQSADSFTLFTNPTAIATGYGWPRIAFDAFVARHISVGASLGIFHASQDGGDSITGFLVAPRAGYAFRLTSRLSIWPRLGFTYAQSSLDPAGGAPETTIKAYALTLEVPLAIQLVPRVSMLLAPTFDLGVGGSISAGAGSADRTENDFGIQAGLLLFL
jgi:hypothetical protein